MQIKIHENDAARQKAFTLRKRVQAVSTNFFGSALVRIYLLNGHNPETDGQLPWLPLDDFYQGLGTDMPPFKDLVHALEPLDFIRVDRRAPFTSTS